MKSVVSEDSLSSTVIELQTLSMKGSDITLDIFRQLQDEFPEEDDRPTVLGFVNHHPNEDCRCIGEHRHIIWQKGDELRRAAIPKKREWRDPSAWLGLLESLNRKCEDKEDRTRLSKYIRQKSARGWPFTDLDPVPLCYIDHYNGDQDVFFCSLDDVPKDYRRRRIGDLRRMFYWIKPEEVFRFRKAYTKSATWCAHIYAESLRVPQLFIAA